MSLFGAPVRQGCYDLWALAHPSPLPPFATSAPSEVLADVAHDTLPLRLNVARGELGIELYERCALGPVHIVALSLALPGLSFPIDLSGGVKRFQHRRGTLQHLGLELSLAGFEQWLAPRARHLLGGLVSPPRVWAIEDGLGMGLSGVEGALAFEVVWAPDGRHARGVVQRARASGLRGSALGHALRVVDSLLPVTRRGRLLDLGDVAARVTRHFLPTVGVRAPAVAGVQVGPWSAEARTLSLAFDSSYGPPGLSPDAARSLDLGLAVIEADDALAAGDWERARTLYLAHLELAPKHPEVCRLLAAIDVTQAGREEAALGFLLEVGPATAAGALGAEILARLGDLSAATEAAEHAAAEETYAPLSARLWAYLATLHGERASRAAALDRAVGLAPALLEVRWPRVELRAELGDAAGALADARAIEASTHGAAQRHRVWQRAGSLLFEQGLTMAAGEAYERALRYCPDDQVAAAGLARALVATDRSGRALALLERAVALGQRKGSVPAPALIDLAVLLADHLGDLPQAVARLGQVPSSAQEVLLARTLEGRYRARLGDLAGASLAFGRLRDALQLGATAGSDTPNWLVEAARFELEVQRDAVAAERHLAQALRLDPRSAAIGDEYRRVARLVSDLRNSTKG